MKWFSISGIWKEIRRVRWPRPGNLAQNSLMVILFTTVFAGFFVLCDFISSVFLRAIGM